MRKLRKCLLLFFMLMLPCTPFVGAQVTADFNLQGGTSAPCPLPEQYSPERPDPPGVVTQVGVGIYFMDLFEIDDVEQTFMGDVVTVSRWKDPRLADPARGEANSYCSIPLDKVWSPNLEFVNLREVTGHHKDMIFVDAEGNVTLARRQFLTFSTPMDLARFPFDRQALRVELASIIEGVEEVQLEVLEGFTGLGEEISVSGWDLSNPAAEVRTQFAPLRQTDYHSYHWQVEGERHVGFFVRKLMIPLGLIVCMSWAIFWIHPAQIAPQMGIGATSMLTMIAYQFALSGFLPRISYLTLADQFIQWSLVLVFLAMMEAVATAALVNYGRETLALRLDKCCRVLFPVGFALILLVIVRGSEWPRFA